MAGEREFRIGRAEARANPLNENADDVNAVGTDRFIIEELLCGDCLADPVECCPFPTGA